MGQVLRCALGMRRRPAALQHASLARMQDLEGRRPRRPPHAIGRLGAFRYFFSEVLMVLEFD